MTGENFGNNAQLYDDSRPRFQEGYYAHAMNELVKHAALNEGDTVVEIGMGTGLGTEALLARGLNVVGVEPDPRMITIARERLKNHVVHTDSDFSKQRDAKVPSVRFINSRFGEAVESGKLEGAYDGVVAITAIHWAIRERGRLKTAEMIASLLKSRGRLALIHTPLDVYSPRVAKFSDASEHLLPEEYRGVLPDREARLSRSADDIPLRDFTPYLKPVSYQHWTVEHELPVDTYLKLIQTYWEVLKLSPDAHKRLLSVLRNVSIEEFDSKVPVAHAILLQVEELA
ncbi:MAG TPA: methyltransferase [Candidatus Saccharimonadales bacterium]